MPPIISVKELSKTYDTGFQALKDINLDIDKGEIFALLGPNGAGKTTLISIICGIVRPGAGSVTVDGHDIITGYRAARSARPARPLRGTLSAELSDDVPGQALVDLSVTGHWLRRLRLWVGVPVVPAAVPGKQAAHLLELPDKVPSLHCVMTSSSTFLMCGTSPEAMSAYRSLRFSTSSSIVRPCVT